MATAHDINHMVSSVETNTSAEHELVPESTTIANDYFFPSELHFQTVYKCLMRRRFDPFASTGKLLSFTKKQSLTRDMAVRLTSDQLCLRSCERH